MLGRRPILWPWTLGNHVSALNGLHLRFFCGVATDREVLPIWAEMVTVPSNQDGISVIYKYLVTGVE